MSTQAFISGRLGKALALGPDYKWVIAQDMPQRLPTQSDISDMFSIAAEVKIVSVSSIESVRTLLDEEILFQDSLFLFLSCCDPDLSLSTRIMCGQELEPLLANNSLAERLSVRLLSMPMPIAIRVARRETISLFSSFDLLAPFLKRVFGLQECCDEVHAAWREVSTTLPTDIASELEAEFVEDGTVAAIVDSLSNKDLHSFNAEFVSQSIRHRDPLIDYVAKDTLLRIVESLRPHLLKRPESQRSLPLKRKRQRVNKSIDIIDEALQRGAEVENSQRLSSAEAKTRVDKQIAGITSEFFNGREDLAEKYIADLVDFQLSHSEQEHLAKSLCNLAALALDANRLEMADRLSRYAVDLKIDDPVVFTTRAEVLKNLGYFAASLEAFKEARIRFPQSEYAWVGIADVLKEIGSYDLSLAAYEEAQKIFPGSPVAFNGYVSVLRFKGDRKAAVEYALTVVQNFPDDAVSRSGLAAALRDLGKYSDAMRQYQASLRIDGGDTRTILGYAATLCLTSAGTRGSIDYLNDRLKMMPDNASLLNAKAIYLRRAGQLSESLAVAEKLMADYATYTPAQFSCAGTLVAMGRIEDARRILPETQYLRSELDWSGPRISSIALVAEGHFQEANEILESALKACPWRKEQMKIHTTLGYIQIRLGKIADSVRTLERDLLRLDEGTKQVRLVLLGKAQAAQGNYPIASTLLGNVVSTKDQLLDPLRQIYLTSIRDSRMGLMENSDRAEIQLLLAA